MNTLIKHLTGLHIIVVAGISDVQLQNYFIKDLNFTAFEFAEMLNLIEEEFNIKFSAYEEPHIHTVEDIIKQVRVKLQK